MFFETYGGEFSVLRHSTGRYLKSKDLGRVMKKILVLLGHPAKKSYCKSLADAYCTGAEKSGAEVKRWNVRDIKFDPILWEGYQKIQKLEPDLKRLQEDVKWAEHIVWVFPVWWGGMPAIMKGLIDRIMLPGFAFKYQRDSLFPKRFLTGKTARLIMTMGGPSWFFRLLGGPALKQMRLWVMKFCGISPVRVTAIGGVVPTISEKRIKKGFEKVKNLGLRLK